MRNKRVERHPVTLQTQMAGRRSSTPPKTIWEEQDPALGHCPAHDADRILGRIHRQPHLVTWQAALPSQLISVPLALHFDTWATSSQCIQAGASRQDSSQAVCRPRQMVSVLIKDIRASSHISPLCPHSCNGSGSSDKIVSQIFQILLPSPFKSFF